MGIGGKHDGMVDWMNQPQLMAQRDGEEWINILFIVALAVFWLVGGLIKMASARKGASQKRQDPRKPADAQQRETWQQRLARKAAEVQRAAEERVRNMEEQVAQRQRPEEVPDHRRPDQGRVAVQTRRGGEPVLVYQRPKRHETPEQVQQSAARLRQVRQDATRRREAQRVRAAEPSLGSTAGLSLGASSRPEALNIDESMPERVEQASYAASSVIDYTDVEALRKAILHYEILGKPLSLRDPFDSLSGF